MQKAQDVVPSQARPQGEQLRRIIFVAPPPAHESFTAVCWDNDGVYITFTVVHQSKQAFHIIASTSSTERPLNKILPFPLCAATKGPLST